MPNGNEDGVSLPGVNTPVPRWFLFLAVGAVVAILFIRNQKTEPVADGTNLLTSEFQRRIQEQWELFMSWYNQYPPKPAPVTPPPNQKPRGPIDICQGHPNCEKVIPPPLPAVDAYFRDPSISPPVYKPPSPDAFNYVLPVKMPVYTPTIAIEAGGLYDGINGFNQTSVLVMSNRAVEFRGLKLPMVVASELARTK